jgi:excinuclease ABC subunit C
MREVMTRRLKEIEKTKFIPDLVIIDGWKGQLSSVVSVIENFLKNEELDEETRNLIWELQLVSLAKKEEELFLPAPPCPSDIPLIEGGLRIMKILLEYY